MDDFDVLGLNSSIVAHQSGCLADPLVTQSSSSSHHYDWLKAAPVRL